MSETTPVHEQHRRQGPPSLACRILTVSDTRSLETDRSGALLAELLAGAGHRLQGRAIVRDDPAAIRAALLAGLSDPDTDVLLLTGGTGISPRDASVPIVESLYEQRLPGFGELFRMLSWEAIGAAAMLSRATAGTRAGKLMVAMPGSPAAVELAMTKLLLPEMGHILRELRKAQGGGQSGG